MGLLGAPKVDKLLKKRDIKGLIKTLSYRKRASVRGAAAKALGEIRPSEAVEPLMSAMGDEDAKVRIAVVRALASIGDESTIPQLVDLLRTETNSDVQAELAMALDQLGPAAVAPLIEVFEAGDVGVKRVTAKALAMIRHPSAVAPMVRALQSDGLSLMEDLSTALRVMDYQPDMSVSAACYLVALREWERVVELGAAALEPLIDHLEHKDDDVAHDARLALVLIGDPAVEPLIEAFKLRSQAIRVRAVQALGVIQADRALGPMIAAICPPPVGSKDPVIRTATVMALGEMGSEKALTRLSAALNDPHPDVRDAASEALRRIGELNAEARDAMDDGGEESDEDEEMVT